MSHSGAVALFIGNDITSHCVANTIAQDERLGDRDLVIVQTAQSKKPEQSDLRTLFDLERDLVPELYSLTRSVFGKNSINLTGLGREFAGQRRRSAVSTIVVNDVNSDDTHALLEQFEIVDGICIRCYQKFSAEFLSFFTAESGRKMYNLHPGLLPQYRGVLTFARSMLAQEDFAGFTLHEMTEHWDSGGIVSKCSRSLDYQRSVLENMLLQHQTAAELVVDQIEDPYRAAPGVKQQEEISAYFSHLTETDIVHLASLGVALVDRFNYLRLLASILATDNAGRNLLYDLLAQLSADRFGDDATLSP